MILLDTHVLLWWTSDPGRLSERAAGEIARAREIGLPSIVFWEVALLARKQKIALAVPIQTWMERVLAIPRCISLDLTPVVALHADALDMHPDPADRFIAATALAKGAALVTKDRLLSEVKGLETVW